jgi:hypothetical protein
MGHGHVPDVLYDPPIEYRALDPFRDFESDDLFDNGPTQSFTKRIGRAVEHFILNPEAYADPSHAAKTPGCFEALVCDERAARAAAGTVLGIPRAGASLRDFVWIVRDCGLEFDPQAKLWTEIGRPDDVDAPVRATAIVHWAKEDQSPGVSPRPCLASFPTLTLKEAIQHLDQPIILLPTRGAVAVRLDSTLHRVYAFGTNARHPISVFPASFPELVAADLVESLRHKRPLCREASSIGDIIFTDTKAIPEHPKKRVALAARWLIKRVTAGSNFDEFDTRAREAAARLLLRTT